MSELTESSTRTTSRIDSSSTASIWAGLSASPKRVDAKWLYDEHGSELFDRITRLPEYYPTEAERSILRDHAADISDLAQVDTLFELGSGSSDKTRLLLTALMARSSFTTFVPIDVSAEYLDTSAERLRSEFPGLRIEPVVADFTDRLDFAHGNRRMVAFLGGTLGNLYPPERAQFLAQVRSALTPGDYLLLGVDLVKDPDRIIAAYSDSEGITEQFILNIVSVLAHEVGLPLEPADFEYVPRWDGINERMDLRLRARRHISLTAEGGAPVVAFEPGEELLVEISSKFTVPRLQDELTDAGFHVRRTFTDSNQDFLATVAEVAHRQENADGT